MNIPEGPAWAVAIALLSGVLFVVFKGVAAIVKAGKSGPHSASSSSGVEDERRTTDAVRLVLDRIALAERVIQENVSKTRHDLAAPLQSVILILSEVRQIAESIDRRRK